MFRIAIWFAAVAVVATGAQPAFAVEPPLRLEPSSAWHIDYADERCRLARTFGEAENRHLLYFEMGGPAMHFDMAVSGPGFADYSNRREAKVTFGSNEPYAVGSYSLGSLREFGPLIHMTQIRSDLTQRDDSNDRAAQNTFPELAVDALGSSEEITIAQGRSEPVVFSTGTLVDALGELNNCAISFVEDWGLDLAKHRTASRLPEWTNVNYVARLIQEAYPYKALSANEQGLIRMRVIVDEEGKVAECHQHDASLLDALKSPVCRLMERARFNPALDSEKQPMRSYYVGLIRYVLPN